MSNPSDKSFNKSFEQLKPMPLGPGSLCRVCLDLMATDAYRAMVLVAPSSAQRRAQQEHQHHKRTLRHRYNNFYTESPDNDLEDTRLEPNDLEDNDAERR